MCPFVKLLTRIGTNAMPCYMIDKMNKSLVVTQFGECTLLQIHIEVYHIHKYTPPHELDYKS
jgi:hypothetical protein